MRHTNNNGDLQKPIYSGFNAHSTAADIMAGINLTNKTAIVTGGNTGIGLETVKALAKAGATVIVPARDLVKAHQNLKGIPRVEIESLDMIDTQSVQDFTSRFLSSGRPLHLLINNAGIMWVPLRRDARGIESQLAVNYLAMFQLTNLLLPALKKAQGARVVNVSSQGHQFAPFDFADPNFQNRPYESLEAYGQSKTAVNLFTVAFDAQYAAEQITCYAVHPGNIAGTELGREATLDQFQKLGLVDQSGAFRPEVAASLKSIAQGASTTLWCATSSLLENLGGVYCQDNNIASIATGDSFSDGVKAYSLDKQNAALLWQWSLNMLKAN